MWLILDEADRLIEEGFGETLGGIMKALDGRRRLGLEAEKMGSIAAGPGHRLKVVATNTNGGNKEKENGGRKGMPKIEGFDDSSDEEGDDDWDYETMGPKPKANTGLPESIPSKKGSSTNSNLTPLNSGHLPSSTKIFSSASNWPYWHLGRRTILCSATVSGEVEKLAGVALKDPKMYRGSDVPVSKDEEGGGEEPELKSLVSMPVVKKDKEEEKEEKFTPPSQLDQRYVIVPLKLRLVTLIGLLRSLIAKSNADGMMGMNGKKMGMKIIVFMSCTDSVDYHWKMLGGVQMGAQQETEEEVESKRKQKKRIGKDGEEEEPISYTCPLLPATSIYRLHGSLALQTRRNSLASFASASSPSTSSDAPGNSILLCTSVASRGLDLPLVRAVIQYDLPTEQGVNEYVHRVGRTARVGRGGESWAFVGDKESEWVSWVEEGMSTDTLGKPMGKREVGQVRLKQVGVENVLQRGFTPKNAMAGGREYEARATQVQLAFERWVLDNEEVSYVL